MISLKNVTKLAFITAATAGILKIIEIMSEMGFIYIQEGGAGAIIFKIIEATFPISMALFFYVLHTNQKK